MNSGVTLLLVANFFMTLAAYICIGRIERKLNSHKD